MTRPLQGAPARARALRRASPSALLGRLLAPHVLLVPVIVPLLPSAARAHAVLEPREARAGTSYRGVVRVTHGCDGRATTRVSVTIPEGLVGAKPMPKPGWTLATARGAYERPHPAHHGTASEGVKSITWSGGPLPDDEVDEFVFFARVSEALAPDAAIPVPVEQGCGEASVSWSAVPEPGASARDLKTPAPTLTIRAAQAGPPPTASPTAPPSAQPAGVRVGDLVVETPWMRATPAGAKVAAGYLRVTNTGAAADRLVGASIALAGRADIHTMSMEGGVMRMAPLPDGLAIEPGQTVELKPGGLHLMFEGLAGAPKAGETVPGSLTFARAGRAAVSFAVAPVGAQSFGAHSPGEHGAAQPEPHRH